MRYIRKDLTLKLEKHIKTRKFTNNLHLPNVGEAYNDSQGNQEVEPFKLTLGDGSLAMNAYKELVEVGLLSQWSNANLEENGTQEGRK